MSAKRLTSKSAPPASLAASERSRLSGHALASLPLAHLFASNPASWLAGGSVCCLSIKYYSTRTGLPARRLVRHYGHAAAAVARGDGAAGRGLADHIHKPRETRHAYFHAHYLPASVFMPVSTAAEVSTLACCASLAAIFAFLAPATAASALLSAASSCAASTVIS